MNTLENIGAVDKEIIKCIVDGFNETLRAIESGRNSAVADPGVLFSQIFDEKRCIVELYKQDKLLALKLYYNERGLPPSDTYDYIKETEYVGCLARLHTIEKLSFLKRLYDDNLIIFSESSSQPLKSWEVSKEEKAWMDEAKIHCAVWFVENPELLNFVSKFRYSHIIPTEVLKTYKDNNFKTTEEVRFKKSQRVSYFGIISAVVIAVASPWLMTKCSRTSIEQSQIESIINAFHEQNDELKINHEQMDSIIKMLNNKQS